MAEIAITRRSAPLSRRCPWCHEGEAEDAAWVVCQRDQTPIHGACLDEYGACPTCRDPLGTPAAEPGPRSSSEFDEELRAFLEGLAARPRAWRAELRLISGAMLAAAPLCLISPIAAGLAFIAILALLAALCGPRLDELRALAREIAEGDAEARAQPDRFFAARRAVVEADRALETCRERVRDARRRSERALIDRRRIQLRRRASLDEARRIPGIGPELIDALEAAGVRNLDELRAAGPECGLPALDPRRARLLRSWLRLREHAIERLLANEPGPRLPRGAGILSRQRARLQQRRRAALREAEDAIEALKLWRGRRRELRARLENPR